MEKKCQHGHRKSRCRDCGGSSLCIHRRVKSQCVECGGGGVCEHKRLRTTCKECGGGNICKHGHRRTTCKLCGGGGICQHNHERYTCIKCKGSQICSHDRIKRQCVFCLPARKFYLYKRDAAKRGFCFELTDDKFSELIHCPCVYYGDSFEMLASQKGGPSAGIDRKDNTQGYTIENSVSCCTICNLMKRALTAEQFRTQCLKISKTGGV